MTNIAIIGMACHYPDADSPEALWENALAGRRAFRRIPPERLNEADYFSTDPRAVDATYAFDAALIDGYVFDRVRFQVAGSTYRSADLAHWLALDVADRALRDAEFEGGKGAPRETTGVVVGNTLTGEFSRAGLMRLRWPYVRRVVDQALGESGWAADERAAFLSRLETQYKMPFPAPDEESLAGGLANTIAGRICNYFDLNGGGYTVDGACSSSLLAVTTACTALAARDLDVALAGGVDLSIDPFELIGFARTHALAAEEMRVYDARSAGFWPGEGCGFVVLMRQEDAVAQGKRVLATIRGWGVSSDGNGGITRPEVEGQLLALKRAYRRAGFGPETVTYFEGHGTGTAVGDAVELQALSRIRRESGAAASPAFVGSVKANIGHTKAAAGMAGLIKATQALRAQIVPPVSGSLMPAAALLEPDAALAAPQMGMLWPKQSPLRAGVSAMGFGGINTHLTLEATAQDRRTALSDTENILLRSQQDAELFLLAAPDRESLAHQVEHLAGIAPYLSRSELSDLAAHLAEHAAGARFRLSCVASQPAELANSLQKLLSPIRAGDIRILDFEAGRFVCLTDHRPTIGYLFPGQGSPGYAERGIWHRRFDAVNEVHDRFDLASIADRSGTAFAQPAIVRASMAALRALARLGLVGDLGIGHSLGELTALHWAGVMDEASLMRLAQERGRCMSRLGAPTGRLCCIHASSSVVKSLLCGTDVVIACYNTPEQTVVSGEEREISRVIEAARNRGLRTALLPVSHAFHSPLVADAAPAFAQTLAQESIQPPSRRLISTVTGAELSPDTDIKSLLTRQITEPVQFIQALQAVKDEVDLWIEVGPGQILTGLARSMTQAPVIGTDACGSSLKSLLSAIGLAFALGAELNVAQLFSDRFTRAFDPYRRPKFFVNPCEMAPLPSCGVEPRTETPPDRDALAVPREIAAPTGQAAATQDLSALELVRSLVAARAELPAASVRDASRLLADLHLNSISVSQIAVEAAHQLGRSAPLSPTEFSNATVLEMAQALESAPSSGERAIGVHSLPGIDAWVRTFRADWTPAEPPKPSARAAAGRWEVRCSESCPLADSLRADGARLPGNGVVAILPPSPDESHVLLLLSACQSVIGMSHGARLLLVHDGRGGGGFARSLYLERPDIDVTVLDLPYNHPRSLEWLQMEAHHGGYAEVRYDSSGRRSIPRLCPAPIQGTPGGTPLTSNDLLLITGGGKGIGAECGLALAKETGVRLVLLGRSCPAEDAELASNLRRMTAAGVSFQYCRADVTNPASVAEAVRSVSQSHGPVTAILHSAGINRPCRMAHLDREAFQHTLAPKLDGARNLLAAIDPGRLRLFIGFGSIIARTGLPGEADYATANEWLSVWMQGLSQELPECRCLCVEWSAWAGVGMAERMGSISSLMHHGIHPIPVDAGVSILSDLVLRSGLSGDVIVTGRFGDLPTLRSRREDLPLRRFLEEPQLFIAGIELIADAHLSAETDPYLADHVFQGERLLPGVIGLEAMAQAAQAVLHQVTAPVFEKIELLRPIVVPPGASVVVRVLALVREPNCVEVALRCAATAFQTDHFRALCRFESPPAGQDAAIDRAAQDAAALPKLDLVAERDLYGCILFHTGRFQRLAGYRRLSARECFAEIAWPVRKDWFGAYLPATLLLGDPAALDASLHAIQSCIPRHALLPVAAERLELCAGRETRYLHAVERRQEGDTLTYDVTLYDAECRPCGGWQGLQLRRITNAISANAEWAPALLGPLLTRHVEESCPDWSVRIAFQDDPARTRRPRSDAAIHEALGWAAEITRRTDGKPEIAPESIAVSASHTGSLTLAVVGIGPLGCDMESVTGRDPDIWRDMLGQARWDLAVDAAGRTGETLDTSATRVWTVAESLIKAGAALLAPLTLVDDIGDGWLRFQSGERVILSWKTRIAGRSEPIAMAFAGGGQNARI